jgi:hypothetical protein
MTHQSSTVARAFLAPRAGIAIVFGAMVGAFIAGAVITSLGVEAYRQVGAAATPAHVAPVGVAPAAAPRRFAANVQDFGFLPTVPLGAGSSGAAPRRFATNVQDFGFLPTVVADR